MYYLFAFHVVLGVLEARILKWSAIPFSSGNMREKKTRAVIRTEGHISRAGLDGVVGMEWILLWSRIRSAYSSQS